MAAVKKYSHLWHVYQTTDTWPPSDPPWPCDVNEISMTRQYWFIFNHPCLTHGPGIWQYSNWISRSSWRNYCNGAYTPCLQKPIGLALHLVLSLDATVRLIPWPRSKETSEKLNLSQYLPHITNHRTHTVHLQESRPAHIQIIIFICWYVVLLIERVLYSRHWNNLSVSFDNVHGKWLPPYKNNNNKN